VWNLKKSTTTMEHRIQRAKQSCALPSANSELYQQVLQGIASNVKMGPFTATSGVSLPYYLNSSTNFLDKNVAPKIVELMSQSLEQYIVPSLSNNSEPLLCVGMEVAGGMLVCQLASANNSYMNSVLDFAYIRKERKSTGTCQQLEGPQRFTTRTSDSPLLRAIWVDDALSTGSSMLDGIRMLKSDYNIQVVAALYLVDRSKDRTNLSDNYQKLADPIFDHIQVKAIYDLQQVDDFITRIN
jgi:orotate phosphoribosyltransferase